MKTLFRCMKCRRLWDQEDLLGTYIGHAPDNHICRSPMSCPCCDGIVKGEMHPSPTPTEIAWLDPTPEMLDDPKFGAIWQTIKSWDINVPGAYNGYCGATGNHVRAILDALAAMAIAI